MRNDGFELMQNRFNRDKDHRLDPIWERLYRDVFPNYVDHKYQDLKENQINGIDRTIHLSDGTLKHFEEKTRYSDYMDIALEFRQEFGWEDDDKKFLVLETRPGWVNKSMHCDYITYLLWEQKRGWIFPRRELQEAWRRNEEKWMKTLPVKLSDTYSIEGRKNAVYYNLIIKPNVLLSAIAETLYFDFSEENDD